MLSAGYTVHHSQALMYHFSRNIISASFGEGYINLNPLSAASTPPLRRPGGFCYFYLIISWAYSGVRIHLGWQVLVPFEPLSPCFFSVLSWHLTDKFVVQCICRGEGFHRWHTAVRQRSCSVVPTVAVYLTNVFVLYFDWRHYACRTLHLMALLRLVLVHCKRKTVSWGNVKC